MTQNYWRNRKIAQRTCLLQCDRDKAIFYYTKSHQVECEFKHRIMQNWHFDSVLQNIGKETIVYFYRFCFIKIKKMESVVAIALHMGYPIQYEPFGICQYN